AMAVQIVGAIVCCMAKSFETSSNFLPNLEIMVSSMQKKTGCDFRESGMSFKARDAVTFMNLE
ncbi:hypothetical protein, partial [Enterocloster clostridioformis]